MCPLSCNIFTVIIQLNIFLMINSKTSLFHQWSGQGFYMAQYKTPELAIFSYYVQSQGQAFLIDPTYDVYMYQQIARKRNSKLISILLTHYHADYVAGHTEFKVPIIMGPKATRPGNSFNLLEMKDRYSFNVGRIWIKVLHTPGHTPESSCYELKDAKDKSVCIFTGDTVFLGDVGRPDLAASQNVTKEDLAIMLFNSLQKIKKQVDHSVRIYPTHGAGSACGKGISDGNFCSLERQIQNNYAFKIHSQDQFVRTIMEGMPKAPTYFFYDAKLNSQGSALNYVKTFENSHKSLSPEDFKKQLDNGSLCIDSRHDLKGCAIKNCFLMTEKGTLASWAGLVIPPDSSLVLFTDQGRENDLVQRLLRIGYFNIKGYNSFTIQDWKGKGYETWEPKTVTAKQFVADPKRTIVDVRNLGEWKKGVIQGAKTITLGQIPTRNQQLAGIDNLYVHCKSGWRARLALSILAKNGINATGVFDEFEAFAPAGCNIVEYKA